MSHENNSLARWCFGNIVVVVDGNENMKPMKNKSRDRIDPIVALINAMNIAITQENMAAQTQTQTYCKKRQGKAVAVGGRPANYFAKGNEQFQRACK